MFSYNTAQRYLLDSYPRTVYVTCLVLEW